MKEVRGIIRARGLGGVVAVAIVLVGCTSGGTKETGSHSVPTAAGSPAPASMQSQVADFERWNVVGQQGGLVPDMSTLARWRDRNLGANLDAEFVDGPRVTLALRTEAGYVTRVRRLVAALPHHDQITVSAFVTGVRTLRSLQAKLWNEYSDRAGETDYPLLGAGVQNNHVLGVWLNTDQGALARRLLQRYKRDIRITLGGLSYPITRARFVASPLFQYEIADDTDSLTGDCGPAVRASRLPAGVTATIALHAPLKPGRSVSLAVKVTNHGTTPFQPQDIGNGAVLVDRHSGRALSRFVGFALAQAVIYPPIQPGSSLTLKGSLATAGCSYRIGYAVPPGTYTLAVPVGLDEAKLPPTPQGAPVTPSELWWTTTTAAVR